MTAKTGFELAMLFTQFIVRCMNMVTYDMNYRTEFIHVKFSLTTFWSFGKSKYNLLILRSNGEFLSVPIRLCLTFLKVCLAYDATMRLNHSAYGLVRYALYKEGSFASVSNMLFCQYDSLDLHIFDLVAGGTHDIPCVMMVVI